ncbi:YIP1 family protein [Aquicoccus sp. G2-2]|uniref:YIP1 family protein n=1 Tax=Aquicoccus sp. G2-2 TaxID=3092120 RepID=UPI002ADF8105|nr:YIP1 family protein [Aquicoccus sp. G2-2]MEA1113102.1 YIP1 family protein [Aquicoccus sp. G2-2]
MSVLVNIAGSYPRPGKVIRRLLAGGVREDRAFAVLMAGCAIVFVSHWPKLARDAHLNGTPLNPALGGALMAWLIIMPLVFYLLGFLAWALMRGLGGKPSLFGARLALFWALLASAPLLLAHGLAAGYVGAGAVQTGLAALWLAAFIWIWIAGSVAAGWGQDDT